MLSLVQWTGQRPALSIAGEAFLGGRLEIESLASSSSYPDRIPVLSADRISGRFSNAGQVVTLPDGSRYRIQYSDKMVELVAR